MLLSTHRGRRQFLRQWRPSSVAVHCEISCSLVSLHAEKARSIQETVMFGRGHDQAGILIEPAPGHEINVTDDLQLAELRNNLWLVSHLQSIS